MDLVSSVRKTGSRGGVNFNWDDVASSTHRENYLGHSLKAPVGRWAKGRDLTWYAKADDTAASATETEQEKAARERKEEIRQIKEAEEDALARALGLPITSRKAIDANATGANAVGVSGGRGATGGGDSTTIAKDESRSTDYVHKSIKSKTRHHGRTRSRSRSVDRDAQKQRDRLQRRSDAHHKHRVRDDRDDRGDRHGHRRRRSYSPAGDDRRHGRTQRRERSRSRTPEKSERRRDGKNAYEHRSRDEQRRRSRSPHGYQRNDRRKTTT
ncbi:kinase phosphorylation protein-domain-containing protein [Hypoxylon fragiforme]|uniref:kinase phosphorylation protein-domain-containing protein n=1 Tax=Hypoxylon fragiforme TaxID=63214 RepID=UPI0020C6246F|nr:kinase phosphorylation protein-domain-containing protein [Hypoxylon fragiforme]KAI2608861.1 kinase phosphorylation protein-domain-containing protein [Hypoxylon fragiforme]